MPALSPTMSEGKISKWVAAEGEAIPPGEIYCDIETDKASVAYEAQDDGFLAKILVQAGDHMVEVGAPIGIIVDDKEDVAAFANYVHGAAAEPAKPEAVAPAPQAEPEAPSRLPSIEFRHGQRDASEAVAAAVPSGGRIKVSPLAKTIAAENGVSLKSLTGTGPGGRIVAEDVRKALESGVHLQAAAAPIPVLSPTTPAAPGSVPYVAVFPLAPRPEPAESETIPLTGMRKVIAQRLSEGKISAPHFYVTMECEIDNMMKMRSVINKAGEADGIKVSVNDFIIKASSYALKKIPETNSSWQGTHILKHNFVDISVAVATPTGLITPIVRNVENKGLGSISTEMKQLAKKARDGKLVPQEYQGGNFTISNMGMYGVKDFTAIINPGQSCILAVGSASQILKPADTAQGFRKSTVMNVTLSSDHRVVDGALAAQWLGEFKKCLENPEILLL